MREDGGARPIGERALAVAAVALSAAAGYVDALGYVLMAHVYVANMSGNTIDVGRGLAEGNLAEAAARVWPIVVFTLGLFVSELLYEIARHRQRRSSAAWTLGLEAGALLLFVVLPFDQAPAHYGWAYYVPVGLLALAMGLQNATLVRVGASSVYTTHVTGNLTRLAREGAHALLWMIHGRPDDEDDRRAVRRVGLVATMWALYLVGAVAGTLAVGRWGRFGAALALAVLVPLIVLDQLRPIGGHARPQRPHPIF
jgi:uncharacterized membrane protein YoaK (UPF0700 family)